MLSPFLLCRCNPRCLSVETACNSSSASPSFPAWMQSSNLLALNECTRIVQAVLGARVGKYVEIGWTSENEAAPITYIHTARPKASPALAMQPYKPVCDRRIRIICTSSQTAPCEQYALRITERPP